MNPTAKQGSLPCPALHRPSTAVHVYCPG